VSSNSRGIERGLVGGLRLDLDWHLLDGRPEELLDLDRHLLINSPKSGPVKKSKKSKKKTRGVVTHSIARCSSLFRNNIFQ
jgi:hypothetical protein